jgi:hypothetical protein
MIPRAQNTGRPWEPEDDKQLREMAEAEKGAQAQTNGQGCSRPIEHPQDINRHSQLAKSESVTLMRRPMTQHTKAGVGPLITAGLLCGRVYPNWCGRDWA